LKLTKGEI